MSASDASAYNGDDETAQKIRVLLWQEDHDGSHLDLLTACCQQHGLDVKAQDQVPEDLDVAPLLQAEPAILLIPALDRDSWGVRLAQGAMSLNTPTAIALYRQQRPGQDFLSLALRAGIDEVITLESSMDLLNLQIRSLCRSLGQRIKALGRHRELREDIDALTLRCDRLQRENARNQKRLVALAQTASRLAAAELEPGKSHPRLLIVASSRYQAAKAEGRARQLGFYVYTVPNAESALTSLTQNPPRIILCDCTLPDMDVTGFAQAARTALGETPVFIIAWANDPDMEDSLLSTNGDIDDVVLKSANSEHSPLLTSALLGGLRQSS